ncbi:conserved hypothetical protein [Tenacibaculum sp. 190524A02b]|uniref:Uncharacterized protein n=1 Tax=Tenacibaculum vairaonense TaxID=3137860 RepID=A0ABP1FHX6_9FLAO
MDTNTIVSATTSSDSNSTNPTVKITNNLSYTIAIYDVFNPSSGTQKLPYQYTKLGTIAAGATSEIQTIHQASQLQAMHTGNFKKLNDFYFYQFPIKVMAAVQFSFGNPPPLEFTIASSDEDAMVQSFLFHRYAMANPNSALTKNLYASLKKGSVDDVNAFFSGTKNFSSCTLSSWNAILTYLQMFTSPWQGPYYLYEKAPNPAPTGYIPALVATMNITSTESGQLATLKICSEDSKGNPIYPSNPQTTQIIMNGDGTMGDSDPGSDVSVSLTPVWMNVIQTTMKNGVPSSSYLAGPTVTGTVAGKEVVSSQTARQIPDKPANKNKQSSFDASFGKICQGVGLLVGLLMLGDFAKKIFSSAKEKITSKKESASSEKEFNTEEASINSTPDATVVSEASNSEATFTSDSSDLASVYSETSTALQEDVMKQTMEDTMSDIQSEMQQQLEDGYTPTENYEEAVSDLNESFKDALSDIDNGNLSEASDTMSTASEKINHTLEESSESMAEWETSSLKQSSEAVSDAADESEALDTAQEDYESDMSNSSDDSGYDSEDDDWPSADEMEF